MPSKTVDFSVLTLPAKKEYLFKSCKIGKKDLKVADETFNSIYAKSGNDFHSASVEFSSLAKSIF